MILFPINIIELILKGMLIGIIASAPMGPVGILCVQRTLNKGRWAGFSIGFGAAISDLIYALLTGLGISFMLDFITQPIISYILKVVGSILLMIFGIFCFNSNPTEKVHISTTSRRDSLISHGTTGFWLAFANPLIILLFIAAMTQLSFVVTNHPLEMGIGYISIFMGAMAWWFGLTWLINKIRNKFDKEGIIMINKVIGSIVIVVSLVFAFGTIFNLYSLSWY